MEKEYEIYYLKNKQKIILGKVKGINFTDACASLSTIDIDFSKRAFFNENKHINVYKDIYGNEHKLLFNIIE